jgi:hypothetical protein
MSFKSIVFIGVITSAGIFGATAARASTMTFSDFANGSHTVQATISSPASAFNETVIAGGVLASYTGDNGITKSFKSYCVDLYESISFGQSYSNYNNIGGGAYAFTNSNAAYEIGRLFFNNKQIDDATKEAAFQIAVWELSYETSGSYDLSAGNAKFSGGTAATSGALDLASNWLNELSTAVGFTGISVLESVASSSGAGYQDMVYPAFIPDEQPIPPVPEPSTYALMAAGLAGVGFLTRRRASQKG